MLAGTDGASSITVAVRVRPFTIREAAQLTKATDSPLFLGDGSLAAVPAPRLGQKGIRSVIKVVDDRCLIFDPPEDVPVQRISRHFQPAGKRVKDQTFAFDRVLDENITQGDVYEATTKHLLDSVLDGYNATVFAYGATGCGKTHTITGTSQQPGIIFLTMQELFDRIREVEEERVTEITLSYLEIYNETIRDLLAPAGPKQGLMLREDVNQAVSVAGLSSHHPQNVDQVMEMLVEGNAARTQSPTEANATSSRSHAVLQINVSRRDRNAAVSEPTTMATLSIIDLAGSERASATKNRGERLLEGANINKSLLALGSCINALCDPRKRNHVPYRNSKLTRLLKFSLGGNCKTVMIVCVSPSSAHFDETQNTLRYANRAKNIQTKVVRNVFNVDRHVKDFLKKIDEQRARIDELEGQRKDYEANAMVKFRKLEDKRAVIAKDGIARIKAAYQHSAPQRNERTTNLKRLRLVERRIAMISTWVAGFDAVCETREGEAPPKSLMALKKTAQGILAELEGSRQHHHQQIAKNNWERALDSALQNGLRQLQDSESPGGGIGDSPEIASLKRETELLKTNADREAQAAVLELDRTAGETALMQVLLQAHFETIAILGQIMQMDEQEAVKAARDVLGKLLSSSTEATGQVIRPDGGLQIIEAIPPTRAGTPRRRKVVNLMGPSPMKNKIRPSLLSATHLQQGLSPVGPSPSTVSSPGRRRIGVRKSLAFSRPSPRKRSPVKIVKRGVRWRDDTDEGVLADFQPTPPIRLDSTPDTPGTMPVSANSMADTVNEDVHEDDADEAVDSPTMPSLSSLSLTEKPRASKRFDTGFLTKRTDGSPGPRPVVSITTHDEEEMVSRQLPLQEITGNIKSKQGSGMTMGDEQDYSKQGDAQSEADESEEKWQENKESARRISSAMRLKRSSSTGHGGSLTRRDARRRSPIATTTASTASPDGGLFTASHARRMVKGDKSEEWRTNVLSPRTAPVVKGSGGSTAVRRTTLVTDAAAIRDVAQVRPSSFRTSMASRPGTMSKSVWRG